MIEALRSIDEISESWVESVLADPASPDQGQIQSMNVSPVGAGQVADCARITITTHGGEERSFVAKVPSRDQTSRETAIAQHLYEREVRAYEALLPRTSMATPARIASVLDDASGDFALVLEDVGPAAQVDQLGGFELDHAERAVAELAKLHGAFWGDPALHRLAYVGGVADMMRPLYAALVPMLFDQFTSSLGEQVSAPTAGVIEWLKPRLGAYFSGHDGPFTLQHGDYRPDNMLFDACGGTRPIVIVDFQTISVGAPTLDLAYLLGTSLDPEVRNRHEADLITLYAEALRTTGVVDVNNEAITLGYRRHAFQGVAMLVAASMLVERTTRGDQMFLTMIERSAAMVDELGARRTLS